jgi:hypothetical protein
MAHIAEPDVATDDVCLPFFSSLLSFHAVVLEADADGSGVLCRRTLHVLLCSFTTAEEVSACIATSEKTN